jgi:hypothetical protein
MSDEVSSIDPAQARFTTLDLFPEYPEEFLPQVQDFQVGHSTHVHI